MEFLYGEVSTSSRNEFERHLQSCAVCERQQQELSRTRELLDGWKLEPPLQTTPLWPQWFPSLKWAAAAALLVTTAFATGRFTKPALDPQEIEAKISKPLHEKITRDLEARLQDQAQQAAQQALASVRSTLQSDLSARLQEISDKALADSTAAREQLSQALASLRDQDKALYAALQDLESRRQSEYRGLREDLEKVAVYTDQNLRTAQRQIVQLASFKETSDQP